MTVLLHLCVRPMLEVGDSEIRQKQVGGDDLLYRVICTEVSSATAIVVAAWSLSGPDNKCDGPGHASEMREVESAQGDG